MNRVRFCIRIHVPFHLHFYVQDLLQLVNMKFEAFEPKLGETKLGHRTPPLTGLADFEITRVRQFVGLYVEISVCQASCGFHLRETNWWAWHEGGQDSEAGGGADHFVEAKIHDMFNFLSRSIGPEITRCQAVLRKKKGISFLL